MKMYIFMSSCCSWVYSTFMLCINNLISVCFVWLKDTQNVCKIENWYVCYFSIYIYPVLECYRTQNFLYWTIKHGKYILYLYDVHCTVYAHVPSIGRQFIIELVYISICDNSLYKCYAFAKFSTCLTIRCLS